jgi:stage II sporulation protein E
MGFSLFIPETQATVLGIWETAIACLIFFLLPEYLNQSIKKIPALSLVANAEGKIPQAAECIRDEARERLRGVARVFNEIASTWDFWISSVYSAKHLRVLFMASSLIFPLLLRPCPNLF